MLQKRSLGNFEHLKEAKFIPDLVLFVDVSDELSIARFFFLF
jgi:hypothetical protein